ncbi:MAG: glycine zipper domain-containing protein [Prevotella sp.]|nr:glycine zipper domain-containing protein [Prevotella sp.]
MKKSLTIALSSLLILSGCDTYAGSSAYLGSNIGAILGSAIGGINDGPRGSDVGTIIGMAGGAVVGAIIGNSADQRAHDEMVEHREAVKQRRMEQQQNEMPESNYSSNDTDNYTSGFDATNSGDDRIYDFSSSDYTGNYSAQAPKEQMPQNSSVEDMAQSFTYTPSIEIRNARFVDDNEDGKIQRDEICKIIFEVINRGNQPLTDVVPTVIEANGNRHIFISPSMHIESIAPGKGIRYTAVIKADNRLKEGNARFCVSVIQGGKAISKVSEFNIPTIR